MIVDGNNKIMLSNGELECVKSVFGEISMLEYTEDGRVFVNNDYKLPIGVFSMIIKWKITQQTSLKTYKVNVLLEKLLNSYCENSSYHDLYMLYKEKFINKEMFINNMVRLLGDLTSIGKTAVAVKKLLGDEFWQEVYDELLFTKQYALLIFNAELFNESFSIDECADIYTENDNSSLRNHIITNIGSLSDEMLIKILRKAGTNVDINFTNELCKRKLYPQSIQIYELISGRMFFSVPEDYMKNYRAVLMIN